MSEALFLVFGLGFFLRLREEKKRKKRKFIRPTLQLTASVVSVILFDLLLTHFLWRPAGRMEFRWISLLLMSFLLDRGREESLLPIAGISLWVTGHEAAFPWAERFLVAATLVFLVQAFREFLCRVQERLIFSNVPKILQGLPILSLTAALGALVLQGIAGMVHFNQ